MNFGFLTLIWKELGSHHSCPQQKENAQQTEDQQLFLDLPVDLLRKIALPKTRVRGRYWEPQLTRNRSQWSWELLER
jgi:hypothetical protein